MKLENSSGSNNQNPYDNDKKSVSYNTVRLNNTSQISTNLLGLLCNDGSSYSGIWKIEFRKLQPRIKPNWNGKFDPLLSSITNRPYWQYGSGKHSSVLQKLIGLIFLTATTDQRNIIQIHHVIIEGSSQWVIDRNVTRKSNIMHTSRNFLQLSSISKTYESDTVTPTEHSMQSYFPSD